MSINSIVAKDVTKKFGDYYALKNVNFFAKKGKVTGLLGPNGAGKTTLIKTMTTLLGVSSGTIVVDGVDVAKHPSEARRHIGLAGQFAAVDDFLTGRETLMMVARLNDIPVSEARKRTSDLLEKLGLSYAADKQAKTYSGGMRRRLDLGASLVATPRVLFLDEPTTGLDPRTRLQLWDIIRDLVKKGVTIVLTTQYLEEADALCDYIYLIDKGKIIVEGTAAVLKSNLGNDVIEIKVSEIDLSNTIKNLEENDYVPIVDELTTKIKIQTSNGSDDLLKVATLLKNLGIKQEELSLHRPSLDDVFLSVTGSEDK